MSEDKQAINDSDTDQEFVAIGYVQKAHHLKGELYLCFLSEYHNDYKKLTTLYLTKDQKATGAKKAEASNSITKPQAFTVKQIRPHKEGCIVQLNEVTDRNQAETLKGFSAQVSKSFFDSLKQDGEYYQFELLNFKLYNSDDKLQGTITGFKADSNQDFLTISNGTKQWDVPYTKQLILKVDFETQTLHMDLPEGLDEL